MSQSTRTVAVGQSDRPAKPAKVWAPIEGAPPDAPTQAEVTQWLSALVPEGTGIEIRALRDDPVTEKPDPHLCRFKPDDLDFAVHTARKLSGQYSGIYFVLNGIKPPIRSGLVGKGAKDVDISRRFRLLIDVDTRRATGKHSNATDAEKAASWQVAETIRKALRARGWPEPIVCDSGNGWHLIYAIDLPNDAAAKALVKAVLEALAAQYNTDAADVDLVVYNASRITKFYGSLVMKAPPSEERPHRFARVLSIPDDFRPVSAGQLANLVAEGKPASKAGTVTTNKPRKGGKIARGRGRLSTEERAILYLEKCARDGPAIQGQDGSGQMFGVACRVGPGFELAEETAIRLITAHYNPECQPPWSDQEIRHKVTDAYANEPRRGWLRDAEWDGPKAHRGDARNEDEDEDEDEGEEAVGGVVTDLNLTDMGNGERMVRLFGDRIRYIHPWKKWLVWNGQRWAVDNTAAVYQLAKQVVRSIYREAAAEKDKRKRKALGRWAQASEGKAHVDAMVTFASREAKVAILHDVLDADPWLLNCRNGTIDLRTGQLRPHDRADMLTKMAPVDFDPAATSLLWESTVDLFLASDPLLKAYWQRLCGYAITGVVRDQILPIAYGTGANGKSTLLGALLDTLGPDYTMKASPDLLLAKKNDNHPTERASLFGKRIVVAIETDDGARLAEPMVKELTGNDRISARRMREDPWEFSPTHTLFLATNHKPQIRGTDYAIWRRLKLIPFTVQMGDKAAKKDVPDLLQKERVGILAWLVRGCLDWQAQGLDTPDSVVEATNQYRTDEDTLGTFIVEHCIILGAAKVKAGVLYAKYKAWAETSGFGTLSLTKFGKSIAERGYPKKGTSQIFYHGIGLRPESGPYDDEDQGAEAGHSGHSGQNSGMNGTYAREQGSSSESVPSVPSVPASSSEGYFRNGQPVTREEVMKPRPPIYGDWSEPTEADGSPAPLPREMVL